MYWRQVREDLSSPLGTLVFVAYQRLAPSVSPELGNKLLGLFDCCYRHEAFTVEQRHLILQWRGRLSNSLQKLGKIEFKAISSVSSHPVPPRRSTKPPVRGVKSSSAVYPSNNPTTSNPLTHYISDHQSKYSLMDSSTIRRPGKPPVSNHPSSLEAEENNKNNSRYPPTFTSMVSNSQRGTGAYLADHQHQALVRKPSMHPYVENNANKTKLCKTFSEPNKIRFHNPSQINSLPLSTMNSQSNHYRMMISTPYSQQQFLTSSPIAKPYATAHQSDYYGRRSKLLKNVLHYVSLSLSIDDSHHSPTGSMADQDNLDEQRQSNTEFDPFYHQITESAMSEDGNEFDSPSLLLNIAFFSGGSLCRAFKRHQC